MQGCICRCGTLLVEPRWFCAMTAQVDSCSTIFEKVITDFYSECFEYINLLLRFSTKIISLRIAYSFMRDSILLKASQNSIGEDYFEYVSPKTQSSLWDHCIQYVDPRLQNSLWEDCILHVDLRSQDPLWENCIQFVDLISQNPLWEDCINPFPVESVISRMRSCKAG